MTAKTASVIFQVTDLRKAIDFYTEALGFEQEFIYGEPPFYAGLRLGDITIHLNTSKGTRKRAGKGSLYIVCDEVDGYFGRIKAKGVHVTSELDSYPYGMRDFQIKDLDGNLICFGCPVLDEVPAQPEAAQEEGAAEEVTEAEAANASESKSASS